MRREARVRFLGGSGAEMRCCYPTKYPESPFARISICLECRVISHSPHVERIYLSAKLN